MVMILYSSPISPNCRSILMLLAAGRINDVVVKNLNLGEGEQKKDWYLKINPNGAVPTLDDNGYTLWESRAVLAYLASCYSSDKSLYPSDPEARAKVDRWLYYDNGTLQPTIMKYMGPIYFAHQAPSAESKLAVGDVLKFLNAHLSDHAYLTGDKPTIADFSCITSITMLAGAAPNFSATPNVKAWIERVERLPCYSSANDAGVAILKQMGQATST